MHNLSLNAFFAITFTIIMCLALFIIMLLHYFSITVLSLPAAAQLFGASQSGGSFVLCIVVFPVCKLSPRTTPPSAVSPRQLPVPP